MKKKQVSSIYCNGQDLTTIYAVDKIKQRLSAMGLELETVAKYQNTWLIFLGQTRKRMDLGLN